tara:strand:- start:823 stop:1815 length:993 start_codon:yes stop_codon:yes gene_type:complete
MKIKKEVKVGVAMLISIGLLFWGANFLKGNDIFKNNRHFYAVYDHIDGLTPSSPVLINGFKVGQVDEINFASNRSAKLIVKITVSQKDFFIPSDSKAKIISSDLLGSKAIDLQLGTSQIEIENLDTLTSDIEISLTESVNQQIAPLKKKTESLIGTVDSAITVISSIFDSKARNDIGNSFTSIREVLSTFEKTMIRVDGMVSDERENVSLILTHIESITDNFASNNSKLSAVIDNMEAITDSLAASNLKQTVENAAIAMQATADLMTKVNNGEGSFGALMNNDSLYNNLENAARDLDLLLIDMQDNPQRYVHFSIFGRKNKKKDKSKSNN